MRVLALHRDDAAMPAAWSEVRDHCDPKEAYAEPFLAAKGWTLEVGKGRKRAMRELGARWSGLLQLCSEIRGLRDSIATRLTAPA